MKKYFWTPDFLGITHYTFFGNSTGTTFWASVEKLGEGFFMLSKFFPGCRFSPHCERFDTLEAAKYEAEKYIIDSLQN